MASNNWRAGLLAAIAGLALAACGGGGEPASTPTSPPPTSPPADSAPTITGSPITVVTAGTPYQFVPSAADADGDPLSFSATGLPTWAGFDEQTGMVAGTPTDADAGMTSDIVISVSDNKMRTSLAPFRIKINSGSGGSTPPANAAPAISGSPVTAVQATAAYSFTPSATDPEGQPLVFTIVNRPAWASFNASTGRLSGTPASTNVGVYSNIVISVSDGSLATALPAFTITVTALPNSAPTISGVPATSVQATTAYSFTPVASDPDGQTLTFAIVNKPSWASFNTSTGRVSGTPAGSNVGAYANIIISVSDGSLSASLPAFSLTVTAAPNTAPTISGTPSTSVVAGSAYSFTPTANDVNGDTLAFSVSGKPSWATFSTATGSLSGTPTTAQAGSYLNIVISVSDGKVATALPAFSITVTQPASSGTATLSWTAPTQNTDGSQLTDLAGYRVYHGTSADALNEMYQVGSPGTTTYSFSQLASGTHYFAVAAYTASGVESALSAVGSKTIL